MKNLSHPENQKDKQHEQTIKETIFNPSRGKFPKATGKKQAKNEQNIPESTGRKREFVASFSREHFSSKFSRGRPVPDGGH